MPVIKPSRDQFRLEGDKVVHVPTGASWTTYPERPYPEFHNPGRLGDVLDNGDDYFPSEVEAMALQILRERL